MRKLKLKGSNQKETRKLYIQYYRNNYVKDKNGNDVIIKTKDGIRVLFYDEKDVHAYTISIPISYRKKERCFDFGRARRLNWIKEVIEESCKEPVYKKDFYDKRKKIWFRHYFVPEIKYYLLGKYPLDTRIIIVYTNTIINCHNFFERTNYEYIYY